MKHPGLWNVELKGKGKERPEEENMLKYNERLVLPHADGARKLTKYGLTKYWSPVSIYLFGFLSRR